jgi:hypothetical protein
MFAQHPVKGAVAELFTRLGQAGALGDFFETEFPKLRCQNRPGYRTAIDDQGPGVREISRQQNHETP